MQPVGLTHVGADAFFSLNGISIAVKFVVVASGLYEIIFKYIFYAFSSRY